MENSNHEQVLLVIPKIVMNGIFAMSYWSIAATDKAIYFLNMGKNYLPMDLGMLYDVVHSVDTKLANKTDIDSILSKAKEVIRVDGTQLDSVEFKGGLLRKKVVLHTEDKKIKFAIKPKFHKTLQEIAAQLSASVNVTF